MFLVTRSSKFVAIYDVPYQAAADDVGSFELVDVHIGQIAEPVYGIRQAVVSANITLLDIPVDHYPAALTDSCQKHFHLRG